MTSRGDHRELSSLCWLWTGPYFPNGYGQVWSRTLHRPMQAHRYVYMALRGDIPEGKQLDHVCRVHGCVNPDHLRVVTSRENIMAPGSTCLAKANAHKNQCPAGHSYDPQNTYVTPMGRRQCRICKRQAKRITRARLQVGGES